MRKTLALIVVALLWATCASAQVAFNAVGTVDCTANGVLGTTGFTCSTLTVGGGANRALVVQITFSAKTITGLGCVWDSGGTNQSMTAIPGASGASAGTAGFVNFFGLVAPTSGAKTLKCTWDATASDYTVIGLDYTGVNQTGGATSFPNGACATGNSTTASLALTSALNNQTVAGAGANNTISSVSTQTSLYIDNVPTNVSGSASRETAAGGAASVTHTWAVVSTQWVVCGTDIQAAAGGGGCTPTLALLGVGRCG